MLYIMVIICSYIDNIMTNSLSFIPWSKKKFENSHFVELFTYNMEKKIILKFVEF